MNPKKKTYPGPPRASQVRTEQPTALETLHDANLDLIQAEERLETARRVVMNEFKEKLVKLYNEYGLHVTTSVDFEVTIETMSGTATVENQFGSDQ